MRRDNFTCRYCGAAAPDVTLTVDHVMPTALGGSDEPANLVAACRDCNAGKSASSPDATLVDDVKQGALRWAAAMKRAADERDAETEVDQGFQERFRRRWESWFSYPSCYTSVDDVPDEQKTYHRLDDSWGWKRGIKQLLQANAGSPAFFDEAIRIAMKKPGLDPEARFRYFCGVMWNEVKARQKLAAQYMVEDDDPLSGADAALRSWHETGMARGSAIIAAGGLAYAIGMTDELRSKVDNAMADALKTAEDCYLELFNQPPHPELKLEFRVFKTMLAAVDEQFTEIGQEFAEHVTSSLEEAISGAE